MFHLFAYFWINQELGAVSNCWDGGGPNHPETFTMAYQDSSPNGVVMVTISMFYTVLWDQVSVYGWYGT